MVEEYKVRSGFKCNPWAIKKLSGLQLCAFICPFCADPSAATISVSRSRLLIQMYSPWLPLLGVCAPSDTVVHVYWLVFMSLKTPLCLASHHCFLAVPNSHTSKAAAARWLSCNSFWVSGKGAGAKPFTSCSFLAMSVFWPIRHSVCRYTTLTQTEIL